MSPSYFFPLVPATAASDKKHETQKFLRRNGINQTNENENETELKNAFSRFPKSKIKKKIFFLLISVAAINWNKTIYEHIENGVEIKIKFAVDATIVNI